MIQLISKSKAEGFLINYVDMLIQTGYVKSGVVKKMLAYTFLLDFVEYMHPFISERDYRIIEDYLSKLFAGGNCLLPYPVFCTRRVTLGSADYMGDYINRITESANPEHPEFQFDEDKRISETNDIRTV